MITDYEGGSKWFSAHTFKINHKAVGQTKADVEAAFQSALSKGNAVTKLGILPIGQEAGLSINNAATWTLKTREIFTKLGAALPIYGGYKFIVEAGRILSESDDHEGLVTLMRFIGFAAISAAPVLMYQSGEAFRLMHKWAKENNLKSVYQSQVVWK